MKRFISLILCFTCLTSIAFGADVKRPEISYDSVRDLIIKANPQLKSLKINIEGAESTIRQLNNSVDAIEAMDALDTKISAIYRAEMEATASGTPLSPQEIAQNRAVIAGFEQQKQGLMSSITQMNATRETLKESVQVMRYTLKSTTELVVYTAQNLISSYYKLLNQQETVFNHIADANRQKGVLETMFRVGQATKEDINNISYNINNLQTTNETIERQKKSLITQLNLLIGRDMNTEQIIEAFVLKSAENSDEDKLKSEDLESEYEKARAKNYDLQAQEFNYKSKEQFTPEYRTAEIDLHDLRLKLKVAFHESFHDIFVQEKALGSANATLNQKKNAQKIAELKYKVGFISRNELENAKSAVVSEEIAVKAAQIDYQNAILKYQCFMNGGWPK